MEKFTEKGELKKLVNEVFTDAGETPVTKLAKDFADGTKYQKLFNILYNEKINCKLSPSITTTNKISNWNKINCKYIETYFLTILFQRKFAQNI